MKEIIIKLIKFCIISGIIYYVICAILIYTSVDKYKYENIGDVDGVLVLGAQVKKDSTPSLALKNRLDKAVTISLETDVPIIVSGGQGEDEPVGESVFMKNYLIDNGVDENRIYEENKATSTYENLKLTQALINEENYKLLIITNKFHVFRTSMLAKRLNMDYYICGVEGKKSLSTIIREPLAIAKSFVFDRN